MLCKSLQVLLTGLQVQSTLSCLHLRYLLPYIVPLLAFCWATLILTLISNPNHPDLLSMTSLPVILLQFVSLAYANFTVKWLSLATSAPSQQKTRELKVSVLVFGRVLWNSLTFGPLAVHIDTQYGCGTEESHQQCSADQSWQRHDDHRRATGGHRPSFDGDNHHQG